jgi:hypothetical protein
MFDELENLLEPLDLIRSLGLVFLEGGLQGRSTKSKGAGQFPSASRDS